MNSLEIRVNKDYKRKAERKTGDNNSTLKFTLRRNVPKTNKKKIKDCVEWSRHTEERRE